MRIGKRIGICLESRHFMLETRKAFLAKSLFSKRVDWIFTLKDKFIDWRK